MRLSETRVYIYMTSSVGMVGRKTVPHFSRFAITFRFVVFHSNQTVLNCTSPKIPLESRDFNSPQPVTVTWARSGERATSNVTFTYRADPVVEGIKPLRTIVG